VVSFLVLTFFQFNLESEGGLAMKVRFAFVSLVLVLFCFFVSNSDAAMHKIWFNAWTQAQTGQTDRLCVFVEVIDDDYAYPPDGVKEIKITAPAPGPGVPGKVFYLNVSKDYMPWDRAFYKTFALTDFTPEYAAIPAGIYSVTVTPSAGTAITETDAVAVTFLPVPEMVYPTAGLTDVPETPVIKWGAVKGATHYRIKLVNLDWREPVYYPPFRTKDTDFNYYRVAPGDLKPNTHYSVQIEARSGAQDLDMRSRTLWIDFTTGSW
jgi:hypothetical protein